MVGVSLELPLFAHVGDRTRAARALEEAQREDLVARMTRKHKVTVHVTEHEATTYVRMCGQLYNRPSDYERLAGALTAELGTDAAPPTDG